MIQLRSMLWFILAAALSLADAVAAGRSVSGRDLYRQQCASCHGKAGEGVPDEYQDPLTGDWPVEKLARYIQRFMPEDKPKSLTPEQADAVARYIYGEFYSLEARVKKNPPRVELVRLTNRQYLNTVADLLRQFTGADAAPGPERGLRASYRNGSRRNGGERSSFERVDRTVNFDFQADGAEPSVTGTNTLNVTWSGAVLAEETGDYEFILRTPNGARLWVNDQDEPLIDAGVASGDQHEHKATLRLLGGRAYPLRLEWFKAAKDKLASVTLLWKPPHGQPVVLPAHHLAPARVTPTFVVSTRFPADDSSVGYERGVSVSKEWAEAATQAAIETAAYVVRHLDRLAGSRASDSDRAARLQSFCERFVETAFRRPLTPEQKRQWVAAHFHGRTAAARPEDAVRRVVIFALQSPLFLYLGLDQANPDDFTAAWRLAFGLWDSLPDRELMQAAARGALRTREQVTAHTRRMLADPRAHAKVRAFFHHWLQVNHAEDLSKDEQLFPGFTPEVVADLRTSLNLFLDDVFWSETSDYRRLLLEDRLFFNNRLAAFYGLQTNLTDEFVPVAVHPRERAGVITHPYLLAAFSYPRMSSPIHRGVFLTRNIVGHALKSPPEAVAFKDEEFPADLTMREKVAALTRAEACQTCHAVINPLGFSLEHYDAVGRFRTRDNGRPIDATGEYITSVGDTVRFGGARDVAAFAAASEQAHGAFIEQLFHQIVRQPLLAYGFRTPQRLREAFAASGFNMRELTIEIAVTTALHGIEKQSTLATQP
jgi:hypothetical protein